MFIGLHSIFITLFYVKCYIQLKMFLFACTVIWEYPVRFCLHSNLFGTYSILVACLRGHILLFPQICQVKQSKHWHIWLPALVIPPPVSNLLYSDLRDCCKVNYILAPTNKGLVHLLHELAPVACRQGFTVFLNALCHL